MAITTTDRAPNVVTRVAEPGLHVWVALLLASAAVLLPPRSLAVALAGADAVRLEAVVAGAWLFKALLFLHAVLVGVGGPWLARQTVTGLVAVRHEPEPALHRQLWLVGLIVLVGTITRLIGLGEGLWLDEITTFLEYAPRPFGENLTLYNSQNQHPLYSLLAHASFLGFGESGWALRLPAVLFGVASLPALYWFGAQLVSRREALLATALMAVSYHHIWFSQNARGYTGLLLFTLLGSGFLLRLLAGRGSVQTLVLGYAACMALAVYAHLSAAFIVAGHALVVAGVLLRGRERWRAALPAMAALALTGMLSLQLYALVLPQFPSTMTRGSELGDTVWKQPLWMLAEALRGVSQVLPGGWLGLLAGMAVVSAGCVTLWRRSPAAVGLMIMPAVVTGGIMAGLGHNLWPRFFFFAAGFAILIAVRGVFAIVELALPRRAVPIATAALLLVIAGSAATVPRAWAPKQDFEGARAYVEQATGAGDAVVALGLTRWPFTRYLGADFRTVADEAELRRVEAASAKTWAVYAFAPYLETTQPDIWARLTREYRVIEEFPGTLGGGTVYVLVKE